jgi:hypothetical protein
VTSTGGTVTSFDGAMCKGATPSVEQKKVDGPWLEFNPRLTQAS